MEFDEKYKFIVQIVDGTLEYKGKIFKKIIEKIPVSTLKDKNFWIKEYKKLHPGKTIEIKEKFREGWKIVKVIK